MTFNSCSTYLENNTTTHVLRISIGIIIGEWGGGGAIQFFSLSILFNSLENLFVQMSAYETYRVCSNCFNNTITNDPPILEKYYYRDMKCKSCRLQWVGINVGYYHPKKKWYDIRTKTYSSEPVLCRQKISGLCKRGSKCRWAHNPLELEVWIGEEDRKKSSQPLFECIICHRPFRDSSTLKGHLKSKEHCNTARRMWILPEVGASTEYTGPIRTRPKLRYNKDSHELCNTYIQNKRCSYGTGCMHAHSNEELRVWMAALKADRSERHSRRVSNSASNKGGSYSSSPQEGACRYQSGSSESYSQGSCSSPHKPSPNPEKEEKELDPFEEVQGMIRDFGIEPCLKNMPVHIQITCNRPLVVSVDEKDKGNELKWLFRLKTTRAEYLSLIILNDHKNMFSLGEVAKCTTKGSGRNVVIQPYVQNRTTYLIQQFFNTESYFEVALLCRPEVGAYKMHIIFQITDFILIGREVKVKTRGEIFKNIYDDFQDAMKREKCSFIPSEDLLKVNWEHSFEILNSNVTSQSYPIPIDIEDKVKAGAYDNVKNDQINQLTYKTRFHTLLYLEELEHKKALMKYDLQSQITFQNVSKQVRIENDYGRDYFRTAYGDSRFITFKLNQRLFEGYRSFRPPKLVYIIPNGTKRAYELKIYLIGSDYVVVSISTEIIEDCQNSGALIRFTPEREDYVKMHEALHVVTFPVLFPVYRKIQIPRYWDVDHLLGRLQYERELSEKQKIAVQSIINSKFQSFPTLICGPFGCGKTRTLMIAAKLISGAFRRSNVLIVTKTNSSANIYIELLKDSFDTIRMLREKRGNKRIMFRHFNIGRSINSDKSVREFGNIEDGVYKRIKFFELQKCSIVVTTLLALGSLIPPKARENSNTLFTHIFIDEAAQVIEPEACIALSLAGANTKIALAGDIHQSRPLVLSKYGKMYNLDQSLLQRLEMLPEYEREPLSRCKVNLVENFRSQHTIVEFLSELFYEDSLIANPPSLVGPVNFPALSFLHVSGDEQSLHGSPSFYNNDEADMTIKALRKFVAGGIKVTNIAILTTYWAQVRLFQKILKVEENKCERENHFKLKEYYCIENNCINDSTIEVRNLEGIQGREYDLIIINTVRTLSEEPEDMSMEERLDLGLLDDVSQFNTILTRARGWVLVIGDSDCLTQVGGCSNVWSKYIQACKQVNGFFETYREFEAFRMQIGNTRESKVASLKSLRKEEIPQSKVPMAPNTELPTVQSEEVDTYEIKLNHLECYLETCYQELSSATNEEVLQAIHEQMDLVKISIETMDKQRYIEQMCIFSNYQSNVHQDIITEEAATVQEDIILNEAQDQLFPKEHI